MIRLEQIGFMCANGDSEVQFVELAAIGSGQSFSSALTLLVRDRFGTVTYERANLFAPKADGEPWLEGRAWLISTRACSLATGVAPDLVVGRVLDPYGGTITLLSSVSGGAILHQLTYGAAGGVDAPWPGHSLERQPDDTMAEKAGPDPTNFSGARAAGLDCACGASSLSLCDGETAYFTAVRRESSAACAGSYASARAGYDLPAGQLSHSVQAGYNSGASATAVSDDVYYVVGPRAGTLLTFTAQAHFTASVQSQDDPFYPGSAGCAGAFDQGPAEQSFSIQAFGNQSQHSDTLLSLTLQRASHEPFRLSMSGQGDAFFGNSSLVGTLSFAGLPPGAAVVSCQGFAGGPLVAVHSRGPVEAEPGLALLEVSPNPGPGRCVVRLTLPGQGRASLEVVDVSGRRLWARDLGPRGAGLQSIEVDDGSRLAPGIYVMRLRSAGKTAAIRFAVVR